MDEQQSPDVPDQQVPVVDGQTAYQNLRDARVEIEDVSALLRQALADDDQLAAAAPDTAGTKPAGDDPRETR